MGVISVHLHPGTWSRFAELEKYATERGLTLAEAIHELVNSGLSHQQREDV